MLCALKNQFLDKKRGTHVGARHGKIVYQSDRLIIESEELARSAHYCLGCMAFALVAKVDCILLTKMRKLMLHIMLADCFQS